MAKNPWEMTPAELAAASRTPVAGGPRPLASLPPAPSDIRAERAFDYGVQRDAVSDARARESEDRANRREERADRREERQIAIDQKKAEQGEKLTEGEAKGTLFYGGALQANREWESLPAAAQQPVGLGGDLARATLPGGVVNKNTSPERQRAEQAKLNFIRASLRLESGAAIGQDEYDRQDRAFFPQTGDNAEVIAQKDRARQQVIDGFKIVAGNGAKQVDATLSEVAPASPANVQTSTDGSSTFSTEDDKRYAADVQRLFADPKSTRADFDRLAVQYGARQAFGPDLDRALATRAKGGKVTVAAPTSGVTGPTVLGALAATPAGAFTTGVANAVTLGGLDEIVGATGGDQDAANLAKRVMAQDHPLAYGGGEVAGTIASSLGAGALAARALPSLGVGATSLIGDTAYGAAYGAGENNEDRLSGAGKGALFAGGGNLAGQAVVRGVARVASPRLSEDIRLLRDRGVELTPGQALGPGASRAEEKLLSLPIVGNLIGDARRKALADFNTGVMNDSLGRIGAKLPEGALATKAMAFGQRAFRDAYDQARSGMRLVPDEQMASELTDLSTRAGNGELSGDAASRLGKIYESEVLPRIRNGEMGGDQYKALSSRLGKLVRSTQAGDPQLSAAIGELQSVIDGAARRASDPASVAALDAADEGYALWARVENAARMRAGETGSFTPAQLDSAVQKGDSSIRSRAYLRGEALGQDWAEAGKSILRDQVPNSGTVDRLAAGGALAGMANVFTPKVLVPAGVLATAYLPGVRNALAKSVLAERPAVIQSAAGALRAHTALGSTPVSALSLYAGQR